MLENYKKYLEFLETKLEGFFDSQSPFIFCKKGCAKCCKKAQFPYSLTEIKYLLEGFIKLEKSTQDKVEENLQKIVQKRKKYKGKKFRYDCPFLIDDVCCVYEYRGVVCRTFGLLTAMPDDSVKAPFCSDDGLNYSNVLNLKKRTISSRKFKKLNTKKEPLGFNISYKFLTDVRFEERFWFRFGDKKPLIDWFLEEFE